MRWACTLIATVVGAFLASTPTAHAEEVVRERFSLPLEGMAVDISTLAGQGTEPMRIRVSGTVTLAIDGSELDALSGLMGSTGFDTERSLVRLPAGARIVESDPEVHRYTIEIPRQPVMPLSVDLAPLAARHLVTHSELVAGCTGALEVEVLGPPLPAIAGSVEEVERGPWFGVGHVVAIVIMVLLVLIGVALRVSARWKRARPELTLLQRSKAAAQAIEVESRTLGPAFDHVVATTGHLLGTARMVRDHLVDTRAALRRTRSLRAESVSAQRQELETQQLQILASLTGITERLEETAADLAARGAGRRRAHGADDPYVIIAALEQEVDSAVSATREAGLPA